jgi:hypothetical protein
VWIEFLPSEQPKSAMEINGGLEVSAACKADIKSGRQARATWS